jgi:hypothetical protein
MIYARAGHVRSQLAKASLSASDSHNRNRTAELNVSLKTEGGPKRHQDTGPAASPRKEGGYGCLPGIGSR